MAFDPSTHSVVLFGGFGPYGTSNDTWSWDGAHWRELHPAVSAESRARATMAYDSISHQVLMLAGEETMPVTDPCVRAAGRAPVCTPQNETRGVAIAAPFWGWDGNTWTPRAEPDHNPGPNPVMVTQSDGTVLAYGNGGTWTYDGSGWQLHGYAPADLYEGTAMALDPTTGRVIAVESYQPGFCMPHSGCSKPAYMRTFTWTGRAWKELKDRDPPSAGDPATLVADPAGRGILMLATDGTWRRAPNGRWTQVATEAHSPPATDGMTLVADPATEQVVGFGGAPTSAYTSNETWIWNGNAWRGLTAPFTTPPTPPAPAPVDCSLNGPSLQGAQGATVGATVRITGGNIFTTPPCNLDVTLTLTLVDGAGKPLPVAGNPSAVHVDASASGLSSGSFTVTWTWTDACASGAVTADIGATGAGAFPTPFPLPLNAVPACTSAGNEPSTLSAAPFRFG
jgi:hypothetical protein